MFKARILSSIMAIAILFFVGFSGKEVLSVAVSIIALMGLKELYNSFSYRGYKPIKFLGYITCFFLLLLGFVGRSNTVFLCINTNAILLLVFLFVFAFLSMLVFLHSKYNIVDLSLSIIGIFYIPFMLSFIILTRDLERGFYYFWLLPIGAWSTDTMAYFIGTRFGKTKLIPSISPNKTLEGFIGGVFGCVVFTFLYGYFMAEKCHIGLSYFVLLGFLNGLISQFGDWVASAIKRYLEVKDYGNIIPGHGGIMDRFDSLLFIAPIVYFYVVLVI